MNLFSVKELLAWQAPPLNWLISDGILIKGSRMVVCGSKKSFKSMLVSIDLAFKLALGLPWLTFQTRPCKVFVIQVEIPQSALQDRVDKYIKGHGIEPPDNLWYWTTRIKLDRPHDWNNLKSMLEKIKPDVLILDCMYKILSGNVIDNTDVGRFCDAIDRMIAELGGELAVILVHHKGKTLFTDTGRVIDRGTEASLGASTLSNWYDAYVGVDRLDHDTVVIKFEDLRLAADEFEPITLRYDKHTIGFSIMNEDLTGGIV